MENTTPLVDDLEMQDVFKVKDGEEGGSVMDFMGKVSQLLGLVEIVNQQIEDL